MRVGTVAILVVFCSFAVILCGCTTPGTVSRTRHADPAALRVGITPDYPPLIYKRGARIVGVDADLARELAAGLGRKLEFVELTWEEQIPALNAGRIDIIMSGMSVTKAREVRVAFCDPYLRTGLIAAVSAGAVDRYLKREDILNFSGRVGVVKGTTAEAFVRRSLPGAHPVPLTKLADAAPFFMGKRIKMFIHDVYAVVWLVSESETELAGIWDPLTDEDLAWAVRRQEPEFREAVNEIVAAWRNDGTLKKVLDQWMPRRDQIQWAPRASKENLK
jgi:ABC-type amino acid transport substrate-binding protein